jgi:branched-chain amino acid transport system substrate-binding protein
LFEVAVDVLQRTEDVDDPESIVAAIVETDLDTIVGHISWADGPVPNVAKTPLVGGQWQVGEDWPFDLVITTNSLFEDIPTGGETVIKNWP